MEELQARPHWPQGKGRWLEFPARMSEQAHNPPSRQVDHIANTEGSLAGGPPGQCPGAIAPYLRPPPPHRYATEFNINKASSGRIFKRIQRISSGSDKQLELLDFEGISKKIRQVQLLKSEDLRTCCTGSILCIHPMCVDAFSCLLNVFICFKLILSLSRLCSWI